SISAVRKQGRIPVAASACMYSQCSEPRGSDSTRMVGNAWTRCSFSMLFISRILDESPPDEAWTAAGNGSTRRMLHPPRGSGSRELVFAGFPVPDGAAGSGLGGFFPEFAAQDRAGVGLGQFAAELDPVRALVAGQLLARVGLDLLGGQRGILAHHHHLDHLAGLLVGGADGGHLED